MLYVKLALRRMKPRNVQAHLPYFYFRGSNGFLKLCKHSLHDTIP